MNNQNKQNKSTVDFSKFSGKKEEKPSENVRDVTKHFSLGNIKMCWGKMDKKDQIYMLIAIISFGLTVFLISTLLPAPTAPETSPSEYAPPAEEYSPPLP